MIRETPPVPLDTIGPELTPKQERRRERPESLTNYIRKWWRGDTHTHSAASTREGWGYAEGFYTLPEIARYYHSLGLEFAAITEHASQPGNPSRQTPDSNICQSLLREAEEIARFNREDGSNAALLSGVEANIMFDENGRPTLDIPDDVLRKLDLAIASRHAITSEKEPRAIKESLLMAANHPEIAAIGHPDRYTRRDGAQPKEYWDEYWGLWPEVLETMKRNNVAFEINFNSPPSRKLVEMAARAGVKFLLSFDAHDFGQFRKEQTPLVQKGEQAKRRWAKEQLSEEDETTLEEYKTDRLSHGPGLRAISPLVRQLKKLEGLGVTPDGIVNSSKENLLAFLKERGKHTQNLTQLTA